MLPQAAIFGKSCSAAPPEAEPQQDRSLGMQGGLGLGACALTSSPEAGDVNTEPNNIEPAPSYMLAAADVVNVQPGLSWRERAALKRKQLAGQ